jgi:hypothetical protein
MGTWTEFNLEGLFVNWAAVIISNVSAYMTVFINTVYFHISKLLLFVVFLRESNLKFVMVSLLLLSKGLRKEENNEKKRKRVKRNEIQCMILLKSKVIGYI